MSDAGPCSRRQPSRGRPQQTAAPPSRRGSSWWSEGKATRQEFERFWGALDPQVIYLDGWALAGDPGFPVLNGGESFRLLDAAGAPADPPAGRLPVPPLSRGVSVERLSTGAADFVSRDPISATPGRYAGERAGGRVVLTELSDARQFELEFVEILHDAAAPEGPAAPVPP